MQIDHQILSVKRSAHVFSCGKASSMIQEIWLLLHGYAQSAERFLHEFEFMKSKKRLLLAPQGLSQFYLSSKSNKTGASWMTRTYRESEIQDYLAYLDLVITQQIRNFKHSPEINVLGFSQGAETAARWFVSSAYHARNVLICAGFLAPDMDMSKLKSRLAHSRLTFIHGSYDRFVSLEKRNEIFATLQRKHIPFSQIQFSGGHRLDPESILHAIQS
jgi:predicted esterase